MKKSLSHDAARPPRHPRPALVDEMVVQALHFLAGDSERLGRFFDITGLTVQTLRQAATAPGFDSSVLDYLGSQEILLRAFADQFGYDPAEVDAARLSLSAPSRED